MRGVTVNETRCSPNSPSSTLPYLAPTSSKGGRVCVVVLPASVYWLIHDLFSSPRVERVAGTIGRARSREDHAIINPLVYNLAGNLAALSYTFPLLVWRRGGGGKCVTCGLCVRVRGKGVV